MDKAPRLSAEHRANLVAYLDGELNDTETHDIETVLSRSPVARHEVEMLVRTWELLDELPRPTASADFTRQTLTRIDVDKTRQPLFDRPWIDRARRGAVLAGWAAGLAVSAVVGFLATNRWIPNDAELLVRELPVIENLDLYANVKDVAFLRQLEKSGLFDDDDHASQNEP